MLLPSWNSHSWVSVCMVSASYRRVGRPEGCWALGVDSGGGWVQGAPACPGPASQRRVAGMSRRVTLRNMMYVNPPEQPRTPQRNTWIITAVAVGSILAAVLIGAVAAGAFRTEAPKGVSGQAGSRDIPKATPTPTPMLWTAEKVLGKLSAAGLPMSHGAVQDENSDPNNLLGRPNGYLGRASFDVEGGDPDAGQFGIDRGGVVEIFPSAAAALNRSSYIQETLKTVGIFGTEYHYLAGPVLVRITGKVKPSVAVKFETVVKEMTL